MKNCNRKTHVTFLLNPSSYPLTRFSIIIDGRLNNASIHKYVIKVLKTSNKFFIPYSYRITRHKETSNSIIFTKEETQYIGEDYDYSS